MTGSVLIPAFDEKSAVRPTGVRNGDHDVPFAFVDRPLFRSGRSRC
jgi:hypothetical protein